MICPTHNVYYTKGECCGHCAQEENPMAYVYIKSESHLWTVGFYTPDGKWEPESDHSSPTEAAERCHYLNGGK